MVSRPTLCRSRFKLPSVGRLVVGQVLGRLTLVRPSGGRPTLGCLSFGRPTFGHLSLGRPTLGRLTIQQSTLVVQQIWVPLLYQLIFILPITLLRRWKLKNGLSCRTNSRYCGCSKSSQKYYDDIFQENSFFLFFFSYMEERKCSLNFEFMRWTDSNV